MRPRPSATVRAFVAFTLVRVALVTGFTAAAYATGWWPLQLCVLMALLAAFAVSYAFLYRWQGVLSRGLAGAIERSGSGPLVRRWLQAQRAHAAERTAREDAAAEEFHRQQEARRRGEELETPRG